MKVFIVAGRDPDDHNRVWMADGGVFKKEASARKAFAWLIGKGFETAFVETDIPDEAWTSPITDSDSVPSQALLSA